MHILTQDGSQIIASEPVERFCIVFKLDSALIVASYSDVRKPVTMARYAKSEDAWAILFELFAALARQETAYRMPASVLQGEEKRVHDARTKRKGGS